MPKHKKPVKDKKIVQVLTSESIDRLRAGLISDLDGGISLRVIESEIGYISGGNAIIRHSQLADFARGHHHKADSPATITLFQAEHLARYLGLKIELVEQ